VNTSTQRSPSGQDPLHALPRKPHGLSVDVVVVVGRTLVELVELVVVVVRRTLVEVVELVEVVGGG
jgi:hypothetical protein